MGNLLGNTLGTWEHEGIAVILIEIIKNPNPLPLPHPQRKNWALDSCHLTSFAFKNFYAYLPFFTIFGRG
jgi:hypothetical protein